MTSLLALARPAHGPHAVHHSRLDLDEALAPMALHGPPCCALGQRRGDGVIGHFSKGDANDRALDPGRAVVSWRVSVAAECHRRRRTRAATNKTGGMFGITQRPMARRCEQADGRARTSMIGFPIATILPRSMTFRVHRRDLQRPLTSIPVVRLAQIADIPDGVRTGKIKEICALRRTGEVAFVDPTRRRKTNRGRQRFGLGSARRSGRIRNGV
jgi:hypothetical protein